MATIFLLLLFSAIYSVTAQQTPSRISLGSSLSTNTNASWLSRSGRFAFGFYQQDNGFFIGIWVSGFPNKRIVWTANRNDPPVSRNATLLLTTDGTLILQKTQDQNSSIAAASQPASYASMLDSGNFVLYNSNSQIIWQSFDFPTDTLLPVQRLETGKELISSLSETDHSTGRFRLAMQEDGNLVQYPIDTPNTAKNSIWSSATNNRGGNITLNLDEDGHLYLLRNGFTIKNITNGVFPSNSTILYRFTIDADGILRLYSNNLDRSSVWEIEWLSTSDRCDPKGICGLNGYCTLMDQQASCDCLPGFYFVDQDQKSLGCVKNFSSQDCSNLKNQTEYTMYALENTVWEDDSYIGLSNTTKEDCKANCLGDCTCEAAVFAGGLCRKQKLPLRYGRRRADGSTTIFIKMGIGSFDAWEGKESKKELRKDILIISVSFFAGALSVLALTGVLIYRHHVRGYKKVSEQGNVEYTEDISLRSFTYGELEKVTQDFKEELGKGSFGTVFKGALPNSLRIVAVKRLGDAIKEGEREFQTEVRVIGRTHHRNLVRLVGYCHDGPNRLLVYDYMSNGSLADFLFSPERHPNGNERMRIAIDVARGILYLHEECETQIIHCDIKPQNILMDEYRCAKIADFGLAKLMKQDQSGTFTGIRGTRGYVAPEWHRNLPITVKADVYSFGVVLLEIACCRKSLDMNAPQDEIILTNWVYNCFESGELEKLVDDDDVDKTDIEKMVRIGLWCIQDEPSLRPSMKKVVLMLEGIVDIPVPPSPTSFFSVV